MHRTQTGRLAILAMGLLALAAQAWSQADSRRPSSEEIVRRLSEPAEQPLRPRGVQPKGIAVEGNRPGPAAETAAAALRSIDLEVNFDTGSAVLTPDARLVLDNLGKALGDPALRQVRFMVAGHTDAAGSDAFNDLLSRRRAQAVADYLAREHGVDVARLRIEGYGRSRLLDAGNPLSAINRRVQVVNLGGN